MGVFSQNRGAKLWRCLRIIAPAAGRIPIFWYVGSRPVASNTYLVVSMVITSVLLRPNDVPPK